MAARWMLKGQVLGGCSCDWGCPCNFNARPTQGFCDGGYVWHVSEGRFRSIKLDDLSFALVGHSPGPLHEGNVTWQPLIEERADSTQREATLALLSGREGGPWAILGAVAVKTLDPIFARFSLTLDGLNSKVEIGRILRLELDKIRNPVTGKPEELRLIKPTGFTSKWADLGRTAKFYVSAPELSFDYSGQYAEYSEFNYSSEA